jgi:hypothetical protein
MLKSHAELNRRGFEAVALGPLDCGGDNALGNPMPPKGTYALVKYGYTRQRVALMVPVDGGYEARWIDANYRYVTLGVYRTTAAAGHAVLDHMETI